MEGFLKRSLLGLGLTLILSSSLVSCASLVRYLDQTSTPRTVIVPKPELNPLLVTKSPLSVGKYKLTPFERKVIREIFGPPVARWAENNIAVGLNVEFDDDRIAGLFRSSNKTILLHHDMFSERTDAEKFTVLIHEVAHYWEFTQYKHCVPVKVTNEKEDAAYRIPPVWKNLNIEQEAELVSIYAVLTYLFNHPDQVWTERGVSFTRKDLPLIEEYMIREMYF